MENKVNMIKNYISNIALQILNIGEIYYRDKNLLANYFWQSLAVLILLLFGILFLILGANGIAIIALLVSMLFYTSQCVLEVLIKRYIQSYLFIIEMEVVDKSNVPYYIRKVITSTGTVPIVSSLIAKTLKERYNYPLTEIIYMDVKVHKVSIMQSPMQLKHEMIFEHVMDEQQSQAYLKTLTPDALLD